MYSRIHVYTLLLGKCVCDCVHVHVFQSAAVVEDVSGEVADLQQKLAILQAKRQEDKARLKELEKYRIQVQQVAP